MNECVVEVMRFLLAQNQANPMVPVSAAAISKVLKELNVKAAGTTRHVIARARVRFMGLGFDIAEAGALHDVGVLSRGIGKQQEVVKQPRDTRAELCSRARSTPCHPQCITWSMAPQHLTDSY